MKKSLKTYKSQPRHINKQATEAMSFRTLPQMKKTVKGIAETFGTSMTNVIIKALTNYFEVMEQKGVIGNVHHDQESAVAFAERNGG